ncbi:MAG: hypothetical protein NZ765_09480, partial [Anaerolineae bacterium]|nr:hypothetical protein [Anaerolineae bacterium]
MSHCLNQHSASGQQNTTCEGDLGISHWIIIIRALPSSQISVTEEVEKSLSATQVSAGKQGDKR